MKYTSKNLKILVPTAAQVLDQAGITRESWNLRKCMDILCGHSNGENLLNCLIRNERAIFEALKW